MAIRYLKRASNRFTDVDEGVKERVFEIIREVRTDGAAGLRRLSQKFDKWNPESFRLTELQIQELSSQIPEELRKDILSLRDRVRKFASFQMSTLNGCELETLPGIILGQKYIPVNSVGVYVPGGRYTLIASAQMSIVPAKVAGVSRVAACIPPRNGVLSPSVVFSAAAAGADEIYSIGGAQAIAAMAYGVKDTIERVDMIAGPGNKYVTEAKKQVFGQVGIDFLAGPTEIGVIADDHADPLIVASDIVAQAEHDPDSIQILITLSERMALEVSSAIDMMLTDLPTSKVAGASWKNNGEVLVVSTHDEAAEIADFYAMEHLEVQTHNPAWYLDHLHNYGSLFIGEESAVVFSDKAVGTNHILPTGGSARFTGGLWVGKFLKNVTYQRLNKEGCLNIAPYAARISDAEGMIGHARSATVRIQKYSSA